MAIAAWEAARQIRVTTIRARVFTYSILGELFVVFVIIANIFINRVLVKF